MMVAWAQTVDPGASSARSGRGWLLLLIGLGGALGTTVRSALETAFPAEPGAWPWATLCINVAGAFVLAVLLETLTMLGSDRGWLRRVRLGVGTGMLGGFTTYSTFIVETLHLGDAGGYLAATGYAATSLLLGFSVAYAGMVGVGALHRRRVGRP